MTNLPHPGEILKDLWLAPIDVSITDAAKSIGVSRMQKNHFKIVIIVILALAVFSQDAGTAVSAENLTLR
jgi:hypothetical protein